MRTVVPALLLALGCAPPPSPSPDDAFEALSSIHAVEVRAMIDSLSHRLLGGHVLWRAEHAPKLCQGLVAATVRSLNHLNALADKITLKMLSFRVPLSQFTCQGIRQESLLMKRNNQTSQFSNILFVSNFKKAGPWRTARHQ